MKKLLSLVIAVALFAIVSCGKKAADNTSTTEAAMAASTNTMTTETTTTIKEVPVNSAQSAETSAGQDVGLE